MRCVLILLVVALRGQQHLKRSGWNEILQKSPENYSIHNIPNMVRA